MRCRMDSEQEVNCWRSEGPFSEPPSAVGVGCVCVLFEGVVEWKAPWAFCYVDVAPCSFPLSVSVHRVSVHSLLLRELF